MFQLVIFCIFHFTKYLCFTDLGLKKVVQQTIGVFVGVFQHSPFTFSNILPQSLTFQFIALTSFDKLEEDVIVPRSFPDFVFFVSHRIHVWYIVGKYASPMDPMGLETLEKKLKVATLPCRYSSGDFLNIYIYMSHHICM